MKNTFALGLCLVTVAGMSICEQTYDTKHELSRYAEFYASELPGSEELLNTTTTKELIRRLSTITARQDLEDAAADQSSIVYISHTELPDLLPDDAFAKCYKRKDLERAAAKGKRDHDFTESHKLAAVKIGTDRRSLYRYNEHECHAFVPGELFAALVQQVFDERTLQSASTDGNHETSDKSN